MSEVAKTTRKRKGAASARTPGTGNAGQAGATADAARARLAEGIGLNPQNAQFASDAGSDPATLARQLTDELRTGCPGGRPKIPSATRCCGWRWTCRAGWSRAS